MPEMPSSQNPLYEKLLSRVPSSSASPTPRVSASVVPWRRHSEGNIAEGSIEVYWVRRSPRLRFMGGWHAFPGGGLSRHDAPLTVHGVPQGTSPGTQSLAQPPGILHSNLPEDMLPGLVTCALRELFEETGLLLTLGDLPISAEDLDAGRRRLLEKDVSFADLLTSWEAQLDATELVFAGRWLTPPLAPMRFDNRFFLLPWSAAENPQPSIIDGELVEGEWICARAAIDQWRQSRVLIAPPILHILRVLAEDGPDDGLQRLREPLETCWGPMRHIEFRPGIHMLPVRTPTLPPATHTNTFLLGHREMVLVDPATPFEDEQGRLLQALHAAQEHGATIRAIWLTHHHIDHIGAVEKMRRELDVPVLAHASSEAPLARSGIRLDDTLQDGQRVELDGDPPCVISVHHTPGHTQGHLSFFMEEHGSLIIGDLVSALSTIVIDPPEGDMEAYLDSLKSMLELQPKLLFPSHGPAIVNAQGKLEEFHAHRLAREEQILDLWNKGVRGPGDLVKAIYTELPEMAHGIAERQVRAHLEHLTRRQAIERSASGG